MTSRRLVDLYVYYEVALDVAPAMRDLVRALQASLLDEHGIEGRLSKRLVADAGRETWMEIYEDVDASFEGRLASAFDRALTRSEVPSSAIGPRHVERFVDC